MSRARRAGTSSIAVTERAGHATEIAREAAGRGVDVIVVNGGDGTINEAINGIAGTADGACRRCAAARLTSGQARSAWTAIPSKAMRQIVGGERRRIDVGRANGRCFLLMAGVGFDGVVVPGVGGWRKRLLGPFAYVIAGVVAVFRAKAFASHVRIDDAPSEMSVFWMIVGNTRSYGGFTDIMFRAEVDDGLLDVAIMHRGGPWRMIVDGIRVLRKRHEHSDNIDYLKARSLEIETPGLPVQLDGEFYGATPMRFEIWPAALTVIVPAGLKTPLFAQRTDR